MTAERWIGIRARRPRAEVEAFLYSHTSIVDVLQGRVPYQDTSFYICRTVARDLSSVRYLADYQAGRAASGLMGAQVFDSEDAVRAWAGEWA